MLVERRNLLRSIPLHHLRLLLHLPHHLPHLPHLLPPLPLLLLLLVLIIGLGLLPSHRLVIKRLVTYFLLVPRFFLPKMHFMVLELVGNQILVLDLNGLVVPPNPANYKPPPPPPHYPCSPPHSHPGHPNASTTTNYYHNLRSTKFNNR